MNKPGLKVAEVKKLPYECQCCSAQNLCYKGSQTLCMNYSQKIKEELDNENKV